MVARKVPVLSWDIRVSFLDRKRSRGDDGLADTSLVVDRLDGLLLEVCFLLGSTWMRLWWRRRVDDRTG